MFFKKKISLDNYLNQRKVIKVKGFPFIIKKIDVLSYLQRESALTKLFDTYANKKANQASVDTVSLDKVKSHYKDVIIDAVINPQFSKEDKEGFVNIESLFIDWDIATGLYDEIVKHSFGKKKTKLLMFQGKK